MKKLLFVLFALCFSLIISVHAQENHQTAVIGFYNLENLFDTENDPLKNDEEFLPDGANQWTPERYQQKLKNLSDVISEIGKEKGGLVILGVSEIENEKVLLDLVATEKLKPLHLGVVHHDSPDLRGVDVSFLYDKDRFQVIGSKAFPLIIPEHPNFITRDQFLMTGILDHSDTLHVLVNHWPSKRGGEKKSMPMRIAAAQLSKYIADSLMNANANAKVIILGDFNDNPTSKSMVEHLGAKGKIKDLGPKDIFNPMWKMYRDGIGSYAYRDSWDMIDNIMVSYALVFAKPNTYQFVSAHVFRTGFMITKTGSYTGYPFRTYAGGAFIGGYSDHFPVYIVLQK